MATPKFSPKANNGLVDAVNADIPFDESVDTESPADALFENDGVQATRNIYIKWTDRERAIGGILGFAARVGNAIHRVKPWVHSDYYWLYATKISGMRGINPRGTGSIGNNSRGNFPDYEFCKLSVLFQTLPYAVLTDGDLGAAGEWNRYVETKFKCQSMILSSDKGAWQFDDPAAPNNQTVRGSMGYPLTKAVIELKWMLVPGAYVFDANGIPTKILSGVNKVNNAAFMGYPAGTLLLDNPVFEPVSAAVKPAELGLPDLRQPARLWNVTLPLRFFDPPRGASAFRGHNLFPHPQGGANGNWFRVRTQDVPAGSARTLFQTYDFSLLFSAN